MAIPKDKELYLPVLRIIAEADGDIYIDDLVQAVSDEFNLSPEERKEYLSGWPERKSYLVIRNRIDYVRTNLKQAEWIDTPKTNGREKAGYSIITDEGDKALDKIKNKKLKDINRRYLRENSIPYRKKQDERREKRKEKKGKKKAAHKPAVKDIAIEAEDDDSNLIEKIESVYKAIQDNLRDGILEKLMESEPEALEKLSIDLLSAMKYGKKVNSKHTGKSGDGGVDAYVNEDALGLGIINVQTKRNKAKNSVKPKDIQAFSGTLRSGISRGVFITTSYFTKGAIEAAEKSDKRIVLIDGKKLAKLMIEHGVGVKKVRSPIEIQALDEDYFKDL